MFEEEIVIPAKDAELSGTLCLPEKHGVFPVVLMVHGSGKLDRNENEVKGQKLEIFNTFAHYLAKNGIASFRYDKRGVGKSTGDYYSTGHFDLIDDAMICLEYLSRDNRCDSDAIFLLGHSEGSIIVPQMSQKHLPIAGIILLAPFIDKIESILLQQAVTTKDAANDLTGVKKLLIKILFKLNDPVKSLKKLIDKINNTTKSIIYFKLNKIPAKWFRESFSIDPSDIYKNTTCSCLIIGGSKDIQCNPDDATKMSNIIQGKVESHIIKDMSHLLRIEPDKPSIFNYANLIKKPIEPQVLETVYNWIYRKISENNSS